MFRRRRSSGIKYFTRNVSGKLEQTTTSTAGPPVAAAVDGAILVPEGLVGSEPLHMVKSVVISGWSWSEDIGVKAWGNASGDESYGITGASAFYIDALDSEGVPLHANIPFLNIEGIAASSELDDFPLRIVHRRRFTAMINPRDTEPPSTFGSNLGGTGPATGWTNAAFLTPGFGTERSIRRRIRLRPNEAFLWRIEVYDFNDLSGTEADKNWQVQGDIIGALSFAVLT